MHHARVFLIPFCAGLLAAAFAVSVAEAAPPKNALGAIAISPDGEMLVAGGDSRVLYLLDPQSLEVEERIYIGTNPLELFFSADGATLAVHTSDELVLLFSTESWKEVGRVENAALLSHAAAADSLVVLSRSRRSSGVYRTSFQVVSLSDGEQFVEATLEANAAGLASRPDASAFAILTKQENDETEEKKDPPGDLKGFDREVFRQQHDGRTGEVILLDASGTETSRTKTWFGALADFVGSWADDELRFFGLHNKNLETDSAGNTLRMFETPIGYNYGIGVAPDQRRAAFGTGRIGTILSLVDGSSVTFEVDYQPGAEEFLVGFTFAADGSIYAGTTAYRLLHISASGELLAVQPIY